MLHRDITKKYFNILREVKQSNNSESGRIEERVFKVQFTKFFLNRIKLVSEVTLQVRINVDSHFLKCRICSLSWKIRNFTRISLESVLESWQLVGE